jgi:hypothetical protein
MKYFLALIAGSIIGVALFATGMYFNPFSEKLSISPFAVSNDAQMDLLYPAVPIEALLYTDDGNSIVTTHPDRVAELWEPTVEDTQILVTVFDNARGRPIGLGIKFSSHSEQTALIKSSALMNSAWHIYIPGRGTLLVDQVENYWAYLRDVVVPARWSSGDSWKGSFFRIMTQGPGALGTGRVSGGSGDFAGMSSEAVESLTARAYSAVHGPVSMDGSLVITLPATVGEDF